MKYTMPQEIEVWYVIPALRRELAKTLTKKYNLNQKEASEILGISEAAVSQYIKEKRAKQIKFTRQDKKEIEKTAKKMAVIKDKNKSIKLLYSLSKRFKKEAIICSMHKKHDKNISNKCRICFE